MTYAPATTLSGTQKSIVFASYLGWTLDAFDFFLLTFALKDIAASFKVEVSAVSLAITLTLAMRPLGALLFGWLAERIGRRRVLMLDIALFSVFGALTGLAPNLITLLIIRVLFGIAMGGEWGVGAALTMENIPAGKRGLISGLLQAGYPSGYLLASIAFGLVYGLIGWRGMFFLSLLPALVILIVRARIPEDTPGAGGPLPEAGNRQGFGEIVRRYWPLAIFAVLLMTGFNFFSHGTQDLYPTFLEKQHGFGTHTVSLIAIGYNIAAILGGLTVGSLSERIGRRWAICIAALLALPMIPLWAFGTGVWAIGVGAFLLQFMVQGAWGVVPAYLNEISPPTVRAVFPGLVYQLGNLIASVNAVWQARIAEAHGGNYGYALALVAAIVSVVIAVLIFFGPERRGERLQTRPPVPAGD